jgi:hypothetical protein
LVEIIANDTRTHVSVPTASPTESSPECSPTSSSTGFRFLSGRRLGVGSSLRTMICRNRGPSLLGLSCHLGCKSRF